MRRFIPLVLIIFACLFLLPAYAAEPAHPSTLTLTGRGEIKATPDQASLNLAVVTQGKTAAEALAQNSKEMNETIDAIKAASIDAKEIQTANLTISPQYVYQQSMPPRLSGYEARNSIIVTIKDLGKLGAVLDKAVTLGINNVSGPVFDLQDKEAAQNEARLKAMADVKKLGALYQKGMGLKLGRILEVNESSAYMPMGGVMQAQSLANKKPTTVEAGELTITAQVTVMWEVLP